MTKIPSDWQLLSEMGSPPSNAEAGHKLSASRIPYRNTRTLQVKRICLQCKHVFSAATSVTNFCSKECNNKYYYEANKEKILEQSRQKNAERKQEKALNQIGDPDLLTVEQFGKKIGVCPQTVRNMAARGQVRIIRFSRRLTYVRWSEFSSSLNREPPTAILPAKVSTSIPINQESDARKASQLPEQTVSRVSTQSIPSPDSNNTSIQWIDLKTACQRYKMQPNAFYGFASRKRIPKKKEGGKTLYHVPTMDRIRGKILPGYVSVKDASKKYHLKTCTVTAKIYYYNIETLKIGKNIYFKDTDFARILKPNRTVIEEIQPDNLYHLFQT